jgi:hypothetical protein
MAHFEKVPCRTLVNFFCHRGNFVQGWAYPLKDTTMRNPETKFLKLRERRSEEATTISEPLATRFLEEVIEKLQAEVDREKENKKKRQPPPASD